MGFGTGISLSMQSATGPAGHGAWEAGHGSAQAGGGIFNMHQQGWPARSSGPGAHHAGLPWSTGDALFDDWLRANFHDEELFQRLAMLPMGERKQIVSATYRKKQEVRNPVQYLVGCIRKSLEKGSPYGQSMGNRPVVLQGSDLRRHDVQHVPRPLQLTSAASAPAATPGVASSLASTATVQGAFPAGQCVGQAAQQPGTNQRPLAIPAEQVVCRCPDWVKEAASDLSAKSKIVAMVYKRLKPVMVSSMSRLPLPVQYMLCVAILLDMEEGGDLEAVATKCLRSCHNFGWHAQALSSSEVSAKEPMKVVILYMGVSLGLGQVALKAACTFATTDIADLHLHVVEMHSFPIDGVATDMEKATAEALNTRVQVWSGLQQCLTVIRNRKSYWKSQGVKVLVLHAMSCADTGSDRGSPPHTNVVVTRSEPQCLWDHLRAIKMLASEMDGGHIAQFLWMDRFLASSGQLDLDAWFGIRCDIDCSNYQPVDKLGWLHMLPKPITSITGRCSLWNIHDPVDGIVWGPTVRPNEDTEEQRDVLPKLTAQVLSVPEKRVFGAEDLSETERNLFLTAQGVDSAGVIQLMRPKHVMTLLGMQDTPLPAALQAAFPCYKHILAATGQKADISEMQGEACGQSRWCTSCEECLRQAFRVPHAGMLTDHVSAWACRVLQAWAGKSSSGSLDLPDLSQYPDC